MTHKLDTLEWILSGSLIIALICSIIICYQVYFVKNNHYKKLFSTWQMPMIFAILADLYFMR
jgi:hypothetical protein